MMCMRPSKTKGFTLLELMLVSAIIGGILIAFINFSSRQISQQRRDKTILQFQQIFNGALAYYVSRGKWPLPWGCDGGEVWLNNDFNSELQNNGYLARSFKPPLAVAGDSSVGNAWYRTNCASATGAYTVLLVLTGSSANGDGAIIAGMVPNGSYNSGTKTVTSFITTPGQNLNNARSVNFAGIYRHGACVPAPTCPTGMTPQIFVVPVSVSGVSDQQSPDIYPIDSFSAYARGSTTTNSTPSNTPWSCNNGSPSGNVSCSSSCVDAGGGVLNCTTAPNSLYWRVCLEVITDKGVVSETNKSPGAYGWGQYATMMAITRCAPANEPTGSDFSVYEDAA